MWIMYYVYICIHNTDVSLSICIIYRSDSRAVGGQMVGGRRTADGRRTDGGWMADGRQMADRCIECCRSQTKPRLARQGQAPRAPLPPPVSDWLTNDHRSLHLMICHPVGYNHISSHIHGLTSRQVDQIRGLSFSMLG